MSCLTRLDQLPKSLFLLLIEWISPAEITYLERTSHFFLNIIHENDRLVWQSRSVLACKPPGQENGPLKPTDLPLPFSFKGWLRFLKKYVHCNEWDFAVNDEVIQLLRAKLLIGDKNCFYSFVKLQAGDWYQTKTRYTAMTSVGRNLIDIEQKHLETKKSISSRWNGCWNIYPPLFTEPETIRPIVLGTGVHSSVELSNEEGLTSPVKGTGAFTYLLFSPTLHPYHDEYKFEIWLDDSNQEGKPSILNSLFHASLEPPPFVIYCFCQLHLL